MISHFSNNSIQPHFRHELENKIRQCHVISFDVFDTLIRREVSKPEDIFEMTGLHNNILNFKDLRIQAQIKAFEVMNKNGRKEINLEDIYLEIPLPIEKRAQLKETEINFEIQFCCPNPLLIELYHYAKAIDKPIVIVSDMYLSSSTIHKMLQKCGIKNYKKLFVSSEENSTKRDTGELFKSVINLFPTIDPKNILHIGDNPISDENMANKLGLSSFLIPREINYTKINFGDKFLQPIYNGLVKNHLSDPPNNDLNHDFWYTCGFKYGGLAHIGFLKWLERRIKKNPVNQIHFIARDGFSLIQIWEKIMGHKNGKYIYASRICFNVATINEKNFERSFSFFISGAHGLTLRNLLDRIGLKHPPSDLLNKNKIQMDTRFQDSLSQKFRSLYQDLKPQVLEIAKNQKELAKKYFADIIGSAKKIALVDVGWSGTSQVTYQKFLNQNFPGVKLKGYYFALLPSKAYFERTRFHSMEGYLNESASFHQWTKLISENRVLFELFFSAPHQSSKGYQLNHGNEVTPYFFESISESAQQLENIQKMNQGSFDFALKMNQYLSLTPQFKTIFQNDSIAPLLKLCLSPSMTEAIEIGQIYDFDAWGAIEGKKTYLAKLPNIKDLAQRNKLFIWRPGMKVLVFNIPIVGKLTFYSLYGLWYFKKGSRKAYTITMKKIKLVLQIQ